MSLYEVTNLGDSKPGEIYTALVIAAGSALARKLVAERYDVSPKNLVAERVNVNSERGSAAWVLDTTFEDSQPGSADESPTLDSALGDVRVVDADGDYYTV